MTTQRKTNQRSAIKRILTEVDRPLNIQEIHNLAREHAPGLGIATVYRAIKSLVEEQWISVVELPGQLPRYERTRHHHHHHFHCRQCGRVFTVHECSGNFERITPKGFRLEDHEIILRGLCFECNQPADADSARMKVGNSD